MKWFKHMSAASSDDKLVDIRSNFGMWGVGVYWTLIEKVAEQMKGDNPIPVAAFDANELCSFCGCKRNKLETFLKHLQNIRGIKWQRSGNIIKIEIKKLLEIKDNYHTDLEETSPPLPSIEGEVEEEQKEKEKEHASNPVIEHWNAIAKQNGLAPVVKFSPKRETAVRARAREPEFDLDKIALEISQSDFLRGLKGNGWKCDFDFVFCSSNNYLKILEGKYRNGNSQQRRNPNSAISRATFKHTEADAERIGAIQESLEQRDRERRERAKSD